MSAGERTRDDVKEKAATLLSGLSQQERETILIKSWMSHDARWFNAVAMSYGLDAANRLNQAAANECGKAEARRMARALSLPVPAASVDDCRLVQEAIIGLMGPNLLDYESVKTGGDTFEVRVQRCFAYEQVARVGVAQQYDCGIFARVQGWFDALETDYQMTPPLARCLIAQGLNCVHEFRINGGRSPGAGS